MGFTQLGQQVKQDFLGKGLEVFGQVVNSKVVQRLHHRWNLPLLRNRRGPRPSGIRKAIVAAGERVNLASQLKEIRLFDAVFTNFTEQLYANGARKAHLMPIIDHASKMAYGWAVGERAKETFRQYAIPYQGMIVQHDQDPLYTGYGWTGHLLLQGHVRLSYALNGAHDNPEIEGIFSRFKAENHSPLLDAQNLLELDEVVRQCMIYYNIERRHSSLGYLAPLAYVERMRPNGRG